MIERALGNLLNGKWVWQMKSQNSNKLGFGPILRESENRKEKAHEWNVGPFTLGGNWVEKAHA